MTQRKTIYIKQRARGFAFAQISRKGVSLEWAESHGDGCGIFWRCDDSQKTLEPSNMCVPAGVPIPITFPGYDYVFVPA